MNDRKLHFNSTLHLKFILVYIIFGFLAAFITAMMVPGFIHDQLAASAANDLYKSANVVATRYLPGYFNEEISLPDLRIQLKGIVAYTEAAAWFTDTKGNILCSSRPEDYPLTPAFIEDFNPAENAGATYQQGTYHDYFEDEVITVIAPVVEGFSTRGYFLLHQNLGDIAQLQKKLARHIYLTITIVYLFSFIVFLAFELMVYLPLRRITEAAAQYALGNLDYEVPVIAEDEMGYLSASLNYMSAQLRDMDAYQKTFVANVSHDFRSPLTSIKGYVEAIADGTIPPELQEKYLNIILFETERLTDLTRDLLELNEFDTKNLLLDKASFDIHEVIRNTAASFEGTCTEKRISIELVLATKHLNVIADKRKIQQVLYNLIDNAIKFSDLDSIITVETTDRADKVVTSVKDNGVGIPRESLNKIWERFYKTDASRGRDKKGTGLGLSIVKESIQAHGENLNVISTEGVGTEFTFTLPKG